MLGTETKKYCVYLNFSKPNALEKTFQLGMPTKLRSLIFHIWLYSFTYSSDADYTECTLQYSIFNEDVFQYFKTIQLKKLEILGYSLLILIKQHDTLLKANKFTKIVRMFHSQVHSFRLPPFYPPVRGYKVLVEAL